MAESERNDTPRKGLMWDEETGDEVPSDLEEQEEKDEHRGVSGEFNH